MSAPSKAGPGFYAVVFGLVLAGPILMNTAHAQDQAPPASTDDAKPTTVTVTANAVGRAVTAQDWHSGTILTDPSWRHRLTAKLSTFVNFDDVTNGSKVTTVRQTATFDQVDQAFVKGQQLFVSLKVSFGGPWPRPSG